MQTEFIKIKNNVLDIIKNSEEEILPTTKINKSGVYMIYVDNLEDNQILPIYIGQSTDMQKRYKSHYQEIIALNRLSYDEYKKYTEDGFYEGAFKSCKIFKYMIEHNCELSNYHMIPLEYCDESVLKTREQFYINEYKSEYFGFNQLNSTSLYMEYIRDVNNTTVVSRYLNAIKNNAKFLKQYWGFGFTIFNYEYAFYKSPIFQNNTDSIEVQVALKEANEAIGVLARFADSKYTEKLREVKQSKKDIYADIHTIETLFEPVDRKINKQKRHIRVKFKEKLDYSPTRAEFEHFIKGMYCAKERKLFNTEIKKKNLHFLAYARLKDELAQLKELDDERKVILANIEEKKIEKRYILDELNNQRKALMSELRKCYLLPSIEFQPYSLKDCKRIELVDCNSILFVISNNGRNATPEAIVVYVNIGGVTKVYYVKNQTTTQKVDYIEKYAYFRSNSFFGKREAYRIIPRNSSMDWGLVCDNHISILSEYKTGINDYSFAGMDLVELNDIIKDLLSLVKTVPKVKINCTESERVFDEVLVNALDKRTYKKFKAHL